MAEEKYKSPKTAKNPTPQEAFSNLLSAFNKAKGVDPHLALDAAGMVPGIGNAADLANVALYTAEGNYPKAGISALAAIPAIGLGAGGSKLFKQIYDKMTRRGVEGLSRTEASFIKRNFDEYKDFVRNRRDMEDAYRDPMMDMDYPDEAMSIHEQRFFDDEGLQKLYKSMKKSSK
jgi:hypothetical protein